MTKSDVEKLVADNEGERKRPLGFLKVAAGNPNLGK